MLKHNLQMVSYTRSANGFMPVTCVRILRNLSADAMHSVWKSRPPKQQLAA